LFERLPKIVIAAVNAFGGDLHRSLNPVLVEIAREVGEGKPPAPN
jgi:hypothetical protein